MKKHGGKKSRRERLRELAASLAPLEHRSRPEKQPSIGESRNGDGPNPVDDTIRVETGQFKISDDFADGASGRRGWLLWLDPAVAFVALVFVAFILLVAYLIRSGAPPVN